MHPILFVVAGVPVTAYGFALSVAFAAGILMARYRARAEGLDRELVTEVAIVILVTSLLGSRLLYAIEYPRLFVPPDGSWTNLLRPLLKAGAPGELAGLSMSGGVALSALASLVFLFLRGGSPLRYADVLAPSVLLGEGITRIGCFLNGCCHGLVCSAPWGVSFPAGSPAANIFGGAAVHPTQLYASLAGFAGAALLVAYARTRFARERVGAVFFAFFVVIALNRLGIDRYRFYGSSESLAGGWLPHQPLVVGLLVVGCAGLAWVSAHRLPQGDTE